MNLKIIWWILLFKTVIITSSLKMNKLNESFLSFMLKISLWRTKELSSFLFKLLINSDNGESKFNDPNSKLGEKGLFWRWTKLMFFFVFFSIISIFSIIDSSLPSFLSKFVIINCVYQILLNFPFYLLTNYLLLFIIFINYVQLITTYN